jgi:hypothetical protein
MSNLRTAALVAYRKNDRIFLDLVTPQETTLSNPYAISNYPLDDDSSVAVSLKYLDSGQNQVVLGNDLEKEFLCTVVVLSADGFVKRGSQTNFFRLKMDKGLPILVRYSFPRIDGITGNSIALPNRTCGIYFNDRLFCDKDGKVLYLYQDLCDRCNADMKTLDVSGKISGIFECVSDSVDVLSSENPAIVTSIIVAGSFSAINGVPVHNFALIILSRDIIVKPLFNSEVSLDVYDDINIIPLYNVKHSGFLLNAEDRNMTAFMIFGQFKKANGIDVDGCVFATRSGTVIRPALKKINNAIGVFFENYCSPSRNGYATLNKYITIEKR